jgi:hypothetical protein
MNRGSGVWTTWQGEVFEVVGRVDQDSVTLVLRRDGRRRVTERVAANELGDIYKVVTTARWRGGLVIVGTRMDDGEVGFNTSDRQLAERESLYGDQHSGWTGRARVEDLDQVEEKVTVLREAGGR